MFYDFVNGSSPTLSEACRFIGWNELLISRKILISLHSDFINSKFCSFRPFSDRRRIVRSLAKKQPDLQLIFKTIHPMMMKNFVNIMICHHRRMAGKLESPVFHWDGLLR